ncbi:hypothetical protein AGMMS50276_24630 [Synergistales bacterium]|nr:hypothetical protein AGMMS50276_24630 [Synergistales bacterium]
MFGFLSKRDFENNIEKILSEIRSAHEKILSEIRSGHASLEERLGKNEERFEQMQRQERRRSLAIESLLDNQNRMIEILTRLDKTAPIDALMSLAENFALSFLSEGTEFAVLFDKLTDVLTCFDMSLIMDEGAAFDPSRHEACSVNCDLSRPDGSVLEIVRPGFTRAGKVLRYATVVVNRHDTAPIDGYERSLYESEI